ncbi:hypothetical protein Tco_1234482 [Tanacetum coccineum]
MSSRYLPSHSVTPNIMTPMPQEGFAPWSSPYQATVDVGGVLLTAINQERRIVCPSMYCWSPFTNLLDTTVAPKKRPYKSKNKARNGKAPAFDLGNADLDDNVGVNEVLIMATRATVNYICYKNMDPNKVRREIYEECMNFLFNLMCRRVGADLQFKLDEAEAFIKQGADLQFRLDEAEAFIKEVLPNTSESKKVIFDYFLELNESIESDRPLEVEDIV